MSLRPGSRFEEVYRTGRRARRGAITLFEGSGRSVSPELGVVAGRRVGGAVRRNRAKRRMREAARRVHLRPGRAYVVVAASPDVADVAFDDLVEWLGTAVVAVEQRTVAHRGESNE